MTADHRFETCATDMGYDFSGYIKVGGNYSPVVRDGKQLWVSGQIPRVGDEVLFVDVLGLRGRGAHAHIGGCDEVAQRRGSRTGHGGHSKRGAGMSQMPSVLTDALRQAARRSVLCWPATVDAQGQPNVSPKEVWVITDDRIPVRSVLLITVQSVFPIVAPSYWLFPEHTTETSQMEAARRAYGLSSLVNPRHSAKLNPSSTLPDPRG